MPAVRRSALSRRGMPTRAAFCRFFAGSLCEILLDKEPLRSILMSCHERRAGERPQHCERFSAAEAPTGHQHVAVWLQSDEPTHSKELHCAEYGFGSD
jgi:hypothetical protein